jgi:hypothetical protein
MNAFNTCYKWAKENNMQAEDILTLKRQQEKSSKRGISKQKQKTMALFL